MFFRRDVDNIFLDSLEGKKSRKRPKDAPKIAKSAYFIFSDRHREKIKADHPDWNNPEVMLKPCRIVSGIARLIHCSDVC